MSTADDVTDDDGSIAWGRLWTSIFGAWALAMIYGVLRGVRLWVQSIYDAAAGILAYVAALISAAWAIPDSMLSAAWDSATQFIVQLGPGAFPVAIVLTAATLWLGFMAVRGVVRA